MDTNTIRNGLEQKGIESSEEYFEFDAGKKETLEIAKIYEKYSDLFTKENIDQIKNNRRLSKNNERGLGFLEIYLVGSFISNHLKEIIEESNNYYNNAKVTVDGKRILYNEISKIIFNEDDRGRREMLSNKGKYIDKKMTNYSQIKLKRKYDILKELGYDSYIDFYQKLKDKDYNKTAEQVRRILVDTEEVYKEVLRKYLDIDLKFAKHHDICPIFRSKKFDKFFPKDKMKEILVESVNDFGFDIGKNILLDFDYRERKTNRACCFSIKIPQDIRILVNPKGGVQDYKSMFHEIGHGLHHSNTDEDLVFELRELGDNSITETFAYLFENFITNEEWLEKNTEMNEDQIEDFLDSKKFQELYMLRRYSGKLLYELKFHGNDYRKLDNEFKPIDGENYNSMPQCYRGILTKATKLHYKDRNYLLDMDGGFYSAEYLEAWMMDAQLRSLLKKKFGKNWFENEEAGNYVKSFMKYGNKYPAEKMIQMMGYDEINSEELGKQFL